MMKGKTLQSYTRSFLLSRIISANKDGVIHQDTSDTVTESTVIRC
jgi:hypothetical protein